MQIGKKIQQLRKLSGFTQEQLAEKLNVSRQTVSKWELGTSTPDLESMICFSKLFNVSLDDIIQDEGEKVVTSNEKLTIEDLMQINNYNRKMIFLLSSGIAFIMVCVIAVIVISVINSATVSIEYMLYRYIVVGEYANAPAEYVYPYIAAFVSGIIGIILCSIYLFVKKKNNKRK